MGYVKENLLPREKVLFTAKVSPVVFLPSILMFVIAIVAFIYGISRAVVVTSSASPPPQATSANLVGSAILCLSVFLFLYSVWLALRGAIVMFTTEFAVTNRRIMAKRGFIRRHTLEILLSQVESVSVNQDVLGRVLNFGTVTVTGTGGTSESFRAIVNPVGVRRKVNQILEAYMRYQQRIASRQANG